MRDTHSTVRSVLGGEIHLGAIDKRLANIKHEIAEELKRPAPDFLRVSKLKRQKLRLKDTARRTLSAATKAHIRRSSVSAHLTVENARND